LLGKPVWAAFPEGVGVTSRRSYLRALREQVPVAIEEYYPPWNRWFEHRIYPGPDGLAIFFQDISERKGAEQKMQNQLAQLRALSARLETVRDEENARVAREIHDDMGQQLTALKMDVALLARRLETGGEAAAVQDQLREMTGL